MCYFRSPFSLSHTIFRTAATLSTPRASKLRVPLSTLHIFRLKKSFNETDSILFFLLLRRSHASAYFLLCVFQQLYIFPLLFLNLMGPKLVFFAFSYRKTPNYANVQQLCEKNVIPFVGKSISFFCDKFMFDYCFAS